MTQKSLFAVLAVTASLALTGCEIYLGDGGGSNNNYSYCDDTGCYTCDSWGCTPTGSDGGGWTCSSNTDCAGGCYCDASGTCQETGFCTKATEATDCQAGYVCDDRNTCVPSACPTGYVLDPATNACVMSCTDSTQCYEGCYCDLTTNTCVETGTCDQGCPDGQVCDTARNTCVPQPPTPLCQAPVLCEEAPPVCGQGFNPGIVNGCWNGECIADADCPDGAPVTCQDHTKQADCLADANCAATYTGHNCTDPNGVACTDGQANCTCQTFTFAACENKTP